MKEGSVSHNLLKAKTDCIHCGLCLPVCPTYLELGSEADSPRGRIHMMKAVQAGTLEISPSYVNHIDLCLGCRNCETACPSGVEFSSLLDDARAEIETTFDRSAGHAFFRNLFLGRIFPHPQRLHWLFRVLRLYQMSGLQWLVRKMRLLNIFPGDLASMEELLPTVPKSSKLIKPGVRFSAKGPVRYRVALFTGCVMNEVLPRINEASVRVLTENGCEVVIPAEQICCGALKNHQGERAMAQSMARANIAALKKYDVDFLIVNAAGCGSLLKEYPRLLSDERASEFSARVKDISEFLAQMPSSGRMGAIQCKVAYDDPCHLVHAQRISAAPRSLLGRIPGLELVVVKEAELCCGSAGIYNITEREMSMRLLDRKMENIASSGAQIVATGNPGCILQIAYGAKRRRLPIEVLHPVELLDRAYQAQ